MSTSEEGSSLQSFSVTLGLLLLIVVAGIDYITATRHL